MPNFTISIHNDKLKNTINGLCRSNGYAGILYNEGGTAEDDTSAINFAKECIFQVIRVAYNEETTRVQDAAKQTAVASATEDFNNDCSIT